MGKYGLGFKDNGLFENMRQKRLAAKHEENLRKTKEIKEREELDKRYTKTEEDFETKGDYLMYLFYN